METKERRILFMLGKEEVVGELPLDGYEPGDIGETKERLASKLGVRPEEIEVRITGVQRGKSQKAGSLKIRLFDRKTIRDFIKCS